MKALNSGGDGADPYVKTSDPPLEVRARLVDRVRRQIAAGTYVTERKLDVAVRGLLDDLRSGSPVGPAKSARTSSASPGQSVGKNLRKG